VLPGAGGADPLPPGVSLQSPGETLGALFTPGVPHLAGRAMHHGFYQFTVQVIDAAGTIRQRQLSWNVSVLSSQYGNLPLAGTALVYNAPYTQPLLVMGGSNTYTFSSGALPTGLTLAPSSGVVSGTPINTGSFTVAVQAIDAWGNRITRNVTLAIAGPTPTTIGFTTGTNLGQVQLGDPASFFIDFTGGTPPYTVTPLSPLPPGFGGVYTGSLANPGAPERFVLSGLATTPGVHEFTLQVQDALGNIGARTFVLTVAGFSLLRPQLPDAAVGVPYSVPVAPVEWTPLTWSFTGTLPAGFALSPGGVLSGNPTAAGTFTLQLRATDGTTQLSIFPTLRVSPLAITSDRILPPAVVGVPYAFTITASGAPGPRSWFADDLPDGLEMNASGTIEGTPFESGTFTPTVTVSDGGVPTMVRFTLFVRDQNPQVLNIDMSSRSSRRSVSRRAAAGRRTSGASPPARRRRVSRCSRGPPSGRPPPRRRARPTSPAARRRRGATRSIWCSPTRRARRSGARSRSRFRRSRGRWSTTGCCRR
jgi:hypothetical protein